MFEDNFDLLSHIKYPDDLRQLKLEQLPQVCDELRKDIVKELSVNPGHLASSLGVVEITVALHYVFNTPHDRIVWDVGHQAYGHKILTGRRDTFCTNRKLHGIMPFPSPKESEYDTFACGHASNSISAGGLAFEGLNNACATPNNMLIILNDNNMSIDRSVGGMKEYLLKLNTNKTYNALRFKVSKWLHSKGYLEEDRRKGIIRLSNALKSAISHQQNIFEGLDIRYFGPFDGHNIIELVRILKQLKDMQGPKLLHLHTIKGKGYAPAEEEATLWHAPGKFDVDTGERLVHDSTGEPPRFQDVFGHTLLELAEQNPNIVGVTPAMPTGCSMNIMMEAMPQRTFDVGIAEGHALTFSGGLAKEGKIPFCNIYSAFAQRAYDNLIHDVALLNLPVVLCLDRAGLVGEDGPTHHGAFDMAALRQWKCPLEAIEVGTGRCTKEGRSKLAVATIGPIGNTALRAIHEVEKQWQGAPLSIAHYDLRFLKPLDEKLLHHIATQHTHLITVEDGTRQGGMGSAVMEWMNDHGHALHITRLGLPDSFVEHGTVAQLQHIVGIDQEGIAQTIRSIATTLIS